MNKILNIKLWWKHYFIALEKSMKENWDKPLIKYIRDLYKEEK